ncbi:hypothetical protein D3C79_1117490 [compost metagenome]
MPAAEISGNEEDASLKLWNGYLPIPAQFYNFLFTRAAVHFVKRHTAQMVRQFGEEKRLLFP